MGPLMPLEVHLVGVKPVGVWTAHPHPHLNPHLRASYLPRMWLGVSSQTIHTGGNGVMVVETAGWSSASPRQLPLRLSSPSLLTPEMGKDLEKVV